jgi:hypothetical protein
MLAALDKREAKVMLSVVEDMTKNLKLACQTHFLVGLPAPKMVCNSVRR